ncbi:MAG: GAF domain-containing protein [candidate division WOR-3 bacterium]|nr:GAF domain-containing protein [candidate division WOR-3 bacterium]
MSKEEKLRKELEAMRIQQKVLMRLSDIGRMHRSLDKIYEDSLDLAVEIVSARYGSLLLFNERANSLEFVSMRTQSEDIAEKLRSLKLKKGEGLAGWVYLTGIPILSNDVRNDEKWKRKIAEEIDYIPGNILCLPITGSSSIIGVLELIDRRSDSAFDDNDLEIAKLFASQLSVIIENRTLYNGLEEEIGRIRNLIETSILLSSTLDLDELLALIMDKAKEILSAEASSIFQIDSQSEELYFRVATGEKGEAAKSIRVPVGKGIVGWAAENMRTVYVPDVSRDERFYKDVDEKTKFSTKSVIAVPLVTKKGVIGVAEVLNKKGGGQFTDDDIRIFESLARQSAVAIENAKLYNDLSELTKQSISSIVTAVEKRDRYTRGHTERVTEYCLKIAEAMGFDSEKMHKLELAALLHDVGKIGISDNILLKKGALTDEEYDEIKKHPRKGIEIVGRIEQLSEIKEGILYHHERIDGRGYPAGLKGNEIPLTARIIAVADAYDAMTTNRPYRNSLSVEEAKRRLSESSGTQFDPRIVEIMLLILEKESDE